MTRPVVDLAHLPALVAAAKAVGVPLDGHTLGMIAEAQAAALLDLRLAPQSTAGFDAYDRDGRTVEIKATTGAVVGLRGSPPEMLAVVRLDPATLVATVVYYGPAAPAWEAAGPRQSNGQSPLRLARLTQLEGGRSPDKSLE